MRNGLHKFVCPIAHNNVYYNAPGIITGAAGLATRPGALPFPLHFFSEICYIIPMRIISCCLLIFAALLSGCPDYYDSLPEPELPVEEIHFSAADYDHAGNTITLSFAQVFPYEGIYPTYNREYLFDMSKYVNDNFRFASSAVIDTGIKLTLYPNDTVPPEITFKTTIPCYLYSNRYSGIEAKAFFKTERLSITSIPAAP